VFVDKKSLVFGLLLLLVPVSAISQYPNVQVSNSSFPPDAEEVTISINPANPQNLAAGANLNYCFYSMDGGLTWTQDRLFSTYTVWGDPCVTFDADGNLFYAHLSWPGVTEGDWLDRIVVQKSIDGGVTWDNGTGAGLNPPKDQDKDWLTADVTASPYRNNLYVAWTEFDNLWDPAPADSSRILFSRSTDHGASWSTPARISELGGLCFDDDDTVEGAVPAVGPNGEIYLSWSGHGLVYFDKSLDGGITWGTDRIIATQPGGWNFDIPGIYRCNGFPVTLCDASKSPYSGHIYVVFSDQRNGFDDTDVFFIKSADGGLNWTNPAKVITEKIPAHQFFPWATIDPVTGNLYVVFYDRRYTTGNATEVFLAMSEDGGSTWSDFEVSDTSFTPQADVFFGDYINVAALNGNVYPIWTRMDSGDMTVWLALVTVPVTGPPVGSQVLLAQNYPNPFNPTTKIQFELPGRAEVELTIYDVGGRRVRTLFAGTLTAGSKQVSWDGRDFRGSAVSSGVYFYSLRAAGQTLTRKMTLVK
jgi:hypothetical protein